MSMFLSKMSMVVSHGPWRMFAIPKVVGGKLLQGSLINSRLLLISLLSTSDTATTFAIDKSKAANDLKPPTPGCYAVTPLVYSKRCWVHQSCLAGGLPYIRHLIGRPNLNPPSARSFSTHNGEEKGHQLYDINTEDFVKLVKQNQEGLEGLQLIDVREPEELEETGKIPGSINIPLGSVEDAFNKSPKDFKATYGAEKPAVDDLDLVFSCLSGVRSLAALEIVRHLGYVNARHYIGGWLGWKEHLENIH